MIRKINSIFSLFKQKDAEGVEVWVVSWVARYGDYSTDTKRVYKAFLSKEDAEAFANSLYAAQRILQSTNDLGVRIETYRRSLRYVHKTTKGGSDMTNKREAQFWLEYCYPTTIIKDRYNGAYSGAKWLAFPIDYYKVPKDIDSGDIECMMFWESYTECVGKGNTIEEAFSDLVIKMKRE